MGLLPENRVDLLFVFRWETEPAALPVLLVKPEGYFVEVHEGCDQNEPAVSQKRESSGLRFEKDLSRDFNLSVNPLGDVMVHSVAIWKNVEDMVETARRDVDGYYQQHYRPPRK